MLTKLDVNHRYILCTVDRDTCIQINYKSSFFNVVWSAVSPHVLWHLDPREEIIDYAPIILDLNYVNENKNK